MKMRLKVLKIECSLCELIYIKCSFRYKFIRNKIIVYKVSSKKGVCS